MTLAQDFTIYNLCMFKMSFYSFDYHNQSAEYVWVRKHYHIKDRRQENIQTSRQKANLRSWDTQIVHPKMNARENEWLLLLNVFLPDAFLSQC